MRFVPESGHVIIHELRFVGYVVPPPHVWSGKCEVQVKSIKHAQATAAAATVADMVTGLDYATRRGAWTDFEVAGAVESTEGSGLEMTYTSKPYNPRSEGRRTRVVHNVFLECCR